MIENVYTESYVIYPHDVDFTKHIKATQVLARLLTSAGLDSEEKNSGVDAMHQDGCTWVLSRIGIEIEKQPYLFDTITTQTWVESNTKLINTRNFLLTLPNNEVAIRATSYWSMIDMNSRKVLNLETNKWVANFPVIPTPAGIDAPARVADVKEGTTFQHTIAYNDMDYNLHANSVRYLQWVLDTYALEQFTQQQLQRIDINYQHESYFGSAVNIVKQENDGEHIFSIKNEDGTTLCKIKLLWKSKAE